MSRFYKTMLPAALLALVLPLTGCEAPTMPPYASSQEEISAPMSDPDVPDAMGETPAMGAGETPPAKLDHTRQDWGHGGPRNAADNRPVSPETFQKKYGRYDADFIAPKEGKVYLTFDEGYENGCTGQILDALKEKRCPAVFFVTGDYVKRNPELVRRMLDEGHQVGNHSVSHPGMPSLSREEAIREVMGLHNTVKKQFGYEMHLFRFPMGQYSEALLALMQEQGYRSVFWSFAYADWDPKKQMPPEKALQKIEGELHDGAILLLHAVSQTNADVLGELIDRTRSKGLVFAPYPRQFSR